MGYYLSASAIRTTDCDMVQRSVIAYCAEHQVKTQSMGSATDIDDSTDAVIHQPVGDWTCVLWPSYFNGFNFALCRSLAAHNKLMISTIDVYDGDYWEHLFLNGDAIVHQFSAWPDYDVETVDEANIRKKEWAGDSTKLCEVLGIVADDIGRYMVHLPLEPDEEPGPAPAKRAWFERLFGGKGNVDGHAKERAPRKAYPTDEFPLDNFWVFTDFWAKLGITYPDPPHAGIHGVVRLSKWFSKHLPAD